MLLPIGPHADFIVVNVFYTTVFPPVPVGLPAVGLNPLTPLKAAGIRILPAMSVPIENTANLAATEAPSPPELPPIDLDRS